jgi:hypothetical protein
LATVALSGLQRDRARAFGRLGEARHCVADKIMRPDMRELAARIEPDCSAKRPPAAAERVVLAQIVPGSRVNQTVEKGEEIGTWVGLGRVVSRRIVRFRIFGRHRLENTPLDQQEARAGVNTGDKSIRGLALFLFARRSDVADLTVWRGSPAAARCKAA